MIKTEKDRLTIGTILMDENGERRTENSPPTYCVWVSRVFGYRNLGGILARLLSPIYRLCPDS